MDNNGDSAQNLEDQIKTKKIDEIKTRLADISTETGIVLVPGIQTNALGISPIFLFFTTEEFKKLSGSTESKDTTSN